MPKDTVGVALFGLGRMGEIHLENLAANPDVRLKWMIDVAGAEEKAGELCRQHDLQEAQFVDASDCQQVFDDPGTAAIVIASPTRFHEAVIKQAVASGKHVFCEKPIAFTADVVKSCYDEAQKHGCVIFCAFNRRFEAQHIKLKETLRSGKLGCLRFIHYNARDAKTSSCYIHTYIKTSGGIFCDSAIHQLDYVVWLLGERPCSVTAVGGCRSGEAESFRACGDVDHVLITLHFPSQVHAYIQVVRETQRDFPYIRMEVVGTERTYFSHSVTPGTLSTQGLDGSGQEERCPVDFASSYKQELDCFVRVVQGKEECPVPAEEVVLASHLADLSLTSLREGRTVKV
ncbi:putative oxidoreductase YrbE [Babylonia areolata]|uniref:putative oxidoreductase YrbE n=1 Tax=Babylonia areolata TaxID=304850 RepID=UPI003FD69835